MKIELRDGIYWLEEPEYVDIDDFALKVDSTGVLGLKRDMTINTMFVVAFTKVFDNNIKLFNLARKNNGKYCYADTTYDNETYNPVGVN